MTETRKLTDRLSLAYEIDAALNAPLVLAPMCEPSFVVHPDTYLTSREAQALDHRKDGAK